MRDSRAVGLSHRQTIHPDQAHLLVLLVLLVAQRIHPGYVAGNRPIHLQRSYVHTFQQVQKQEGVKFCKISFDENNFSSVPQFSYIFTHKCKLTSIFSLILESSLSLLRQK